eukprot:267091_1
MGAVCFLILAYSFLCVPKGSLNHLNDKAGVNWMTESLEGSRNDWTGQVGFEFTVHKSFEVTCLARGINNPAQNQLLETTTVTLWDVETKNILMQLLVGPTSYVEDRYAMEYTNASDTVTLYRGKSYRISQLCHSRMRDVWNDDYNFEPNQCLRNYATLAQGCYDGRDDANAFPSRLDGANRRAGMLSFCVKTIDIHQYNYLDDHLCKDLANSIHVRYDVMQMVECIEYCQTMNDCEMINYFAYAVIFMDDAYAQCYIFDTLCELSLDSSENTNRSVVAYKKHAENCTDYPVWRDNEENACTNYTLQNWCLDRHDEFDGLSASESCCGCGGGIYTMDNIVMSYDNSWMDWDDILCTYTPENDTNVSTISRQWDNLILHELCVHLLD